MASVTHTPPGVIQGTPAAQNVDLSTDELNMKLAESEKRIARLTESAKKEKEGELRGLATSKDSMEQPPSPPARAVEEELFPSESDIGSESPGELHEAPEPSMENPVENPHTLKFSANPPPPLSEVASTIRGALTPAEASFITAAGADDYKVCARPNCPCTQPWIDTITGKEYDFCCNSCRMGTPCTYDIHSRFDDSGGGDSMMAGTPLETSQYALSDRSRSGPERTSSVTDRNGNSVNVDPVNDFSMIDVEGGLAAAEANAKAAAVSKAQALELSYIKQLADHKAKLAEQMSTLQRKYKLTDMPTGPTEIINLTIHIEDGFEFSSGPSLQTMQTILVSVTKGSTVGKLLQTIITSVDAQSLANGRAHDISIDAACIQFDPQPGNVESLANDCRIGSISSDVGTTKTITEWPFLHFWRNRAMFEHRALLNRSKLLRELKQHDADMAAGSRKTLIIAKPPGSIPAMLEISDASPMMTMDDVKLHVFEQINIEMDVQHLSFAGNDLLGPTTLASAEKKYGNGVWSLIQLNIKMRGAATESVDKHDDEKRVNVASGSTVGVPESKLNKPVAVLIDDDETIETAARMARRTTERFDTMDFQRLVPAGSTLLSAEAFSSICTHCDNDLMQNLMSVVECVIVQTEQAVNTSNSKDLSVAESKAALTEVQRSLMRMVTDKTWECFQNIVYSDVLPTVKQAWNDETKSKQIGSSNAPSATLIKLQSTLEVLNTTMTQSAGLKKDISKKNDVQEILRRERVGIDRKDPAFIALYPSQEEQVQRLADVDAKLTQVTTDIEALKQFARSYDDRQSDYFEDVYKIARLTANERRVDAGTYKVPQKLMVEPGCFGDSKLVEEFIAGTRNFLLAYPKAFSCVIPMLIAVIEMVELGNYDWFPPDVSDPTTFHEGKTVMQDAVSQAYMAQSRVLFDILQAKHGRLVAQTERYTTVGGVFGKRIQFRSSKGDGVRTFMHIIMAHFSTSYDDIEKIKRKIVWCSSGFTDGPIAKTIEMIREHAIPQSIKHNLQYEYAIVRKVAIALAERMPAAMHVVARYYKCEDAAFEHNSISQLDALFSDMLAFLKQHHKGQPDPPAVVNFANNDDGAEGVMFFQACYAGVMNFPSNSTSMGHTAAAGLSNTKGGQAKYAEGTGNWICGCQSCNKVVSEFAQSITSKWQADNPQWGPKYWHRCLCKACYTTMITKGQIKLEGGHILNPTKKQADRAKNLKRNGKVAVMAQKAGVATAAAVAAELQSKDFLEFQQVKKVMADEEKAIAAKEVKQDPSQISRINAYRALIKKTTERSA